MKGFTGTSKNLLRSEILIPSSETRKMSKKTGGVAVRYVDGFFEKSDAVAAEGVKLQPKEVFRGALTPSPFTP